jgi:adenylyl- and sulfurtransferase ThiI
MKRGCSVEFFIMKNSLIDLINNFLDTWYIPRTPSMINKNEELNRLYSEQKSQKHKCQAICSGVTFSDKKMEILREIKELQNKYFLPVLTPLISMNEQQIRNTAKKVGILL